MHDAGEFWSHLSTPEKLIFGLAGLGLLVYMVYRFRASSSSSASGQQGYQVTLPPTMPAGQPVYDPSLSGVAPPVPAPTPPVVATSQQPGSYSFLQLYNYGLAAQPESSPWQTYSTPPVLDTSPQAVVNYWESLAQFQDNNPAYQQWVQGGIQNSINGWQNYANQLDQMFQQQTGQQYAFGASWAQQYYFNQGAQFLTDPALAGQYAQAVGLVGQDQFLTGQYAQSLGPVGAQQQPSGSGSGLLATPFSSVPHLAFSPVAGTQLTATPFYQPH